MIVKYSARMTSFSDLDSVTRLYCSKYPVDRVTSDRNLPYYVKPSFLEDYEGQIRYIESQVEEQHLYSLRERCFKEQQHSELHFKYY